MIKDNVLPTAKFAIIVAVKITLNQSANLRPDLTQTDQEGLSLLIESVASVAITKRWTVLNTVKSPIIKSQTQNQME